MKIAPKIRTKVTRFIKTRKINKEQNFLNKYCNISNDIEGDAFVQLNTARKTIANYAKSNRVTISIGDAEKEVAKEKFEFDIDEQNAKKAAKNKLKITLRPLKKLPERKGGRLLSLSEYVSKDTSKNYFYRSKSVDNSNKAYSITTRIEDNFLQNIYRTIENQIKALQQYRK